ncbi:hypothetical protein P5637_23635 [Bacillus paralicheniformis]|uniref:Uncharacterized protein n=1 Tax=Bacillus paralicheniformis TaxID=1648923 RepID=A0ABY3FZL1_9BACI|nr:hypothetical protein [Bacillus paralicheniformis]KND05471.1 hypothetical protein ACJ43_21540 [Bacillus paralicheniformis]OLQ51325.1 hypothetical protein BHT95_21145 [Bacillus paralicheniformis]TWL42680.1 hypothetical protein CHCC15381_1856 [Bacillus paralicheniformis]WEZ24263.1 hypothetical protein P5637_23635 [Bacillus paralicheniformis]WOH92251.1 hypothetical protein RZN08_05395 [Bacillus paralicheniformis]
MKYGIEIIENTEESRMEVQNHSYRCSDHMVSKEEAKELCDALLSGKKAIAIYDGEHTNVIFIGEDSE